MSGGEKPRNLFEERFAAEITAAREKSTKLLGEVPRLPPALVLRDGELAVENPVRGRAIVLRMNGRDRFLSAGSILALSAPWPEVLPWRLAEESDATKENSITILGPDDVLVFDGESGALLQRIASKTTAIAVDATGTFVVATNPFNVGEAESVDIGGGYALYVSVEQAVTLRIGERTIRIGLVQRPRLLVEGEILSTALGVPLTACPSEVRILADPDTLSETLSLRVEHPVLSSALDVPVTKSDQGVAVAKLPTLPDRGEFGALRISLLLKERVLARTRIWYWPGLIGLIEGVAFNAPTIPPNLDLDASGHVEIGPSGQLELKAGDDYLVAVVAFQSKTETITLPFPRRGVVVSVAPINGPERSLQIGEPLVLSEGLDGSLVIRSSNRRSALDICGRQEAEPFAQSGTRRIPLAALLIGDGHNEVRYWPDGDSHQAFTLLKLVPSTNPAEFTWTPRAELVEIASKFHVPVDAARLDLVHTINGDQLVIEAAVGRRPVQYPDRDSITVTQTRADRTDLRLRIDRRVFAEGVWTADLSVRLEGEEEWRPVINDRHDIYAFAFDGCQAGSLRRDTASQIFLRLDKALSQCYATPTWRSIEAVLVPAWRTVGEGLAQSSPGRSVLLQAAGHAPPASASSSWVPIQHPLELTPDLFDAPLQDFAVFEHASGEGLETLAQASKLSTCTSAVQALERFNITPLFFTAFANFKAAAANPSLPLRNFSFESYAAAIAALEGDRRGQFWSPARPWLTLAHHSWCCEAALSRLRQVAPAGSSTNQQRLPGVMRFAREALRVNGAKALAAPAALSDEMELISAMPGAISAFARACRRGESTSFLETIMTRNQEAGTHTYRNAAFLIRLAPELLAFYTTLWHLVTLSEAK
ncbi:hypothetical protein [Microvirga pakistanensis]|uniref:hypothetical protein n=2 Tax=Microvirga pakistanensis TaxID=1682650 RepID=UPI00106CB103|nr:hypothetical protein [Microvirga pakistanensis]